MKHLKLFEGFNNVNNIVTTLIEDYGFTKTNSKFGIKYSTTAPYEEHFTEEDVPVEFTQPLLNELIRADKKIKLEGLSMYLYIFDYTLFDKNEEAHLYNIVDKISNTWDHIDDYYYQFDKLLQSSVFVDIIGHNVAVEFIIK